MIDCLLIIVLYSLTCLPNVQVHLDLCHTHSYTGHRLKGRDVVFAGVATHFVPRSHVRHSFYICTCTLLSGAPWHSITWLHVWPMHSIAKSNLGPPVLATSVLTTEHPTTTQTSFIQSCLFAMFILFFCGLKIGSPTMGKAVHILLTVMNQWLYLWIQLPSLKLKMAALCGPEGELSHSDPSTHHQLVKNELDQIHQQVCFTFVCVCTMYMYTYTNIHSVIDVHAHVCVS